MEKLEGFDFQGLRFNWKGQPEGGLDELAAFVKTGGVTDVIILCHGFRNDENDARKLYGGFLKTFGENIAHPAVAAKLSGRKWAVGGAFWPSMVFPEPEEGGGGGLSAGAGSDAARLEALKEGLDAAGAARIDAMIQAMGKAREGDEAAQDRMIEQMLALARSLPEAEFSGVLENATAEALRKSFEAGDALEVVLPGESGSAAVGIPDFDASLGGEGGAQSLFGKVFGFVPKFLNLTTFLLMFHRAGDVGAQGLSAAVRKVKTVKPEARVHLAGHSLGGRAVTACAKSLLAPPAVRVESMMLLQAAYSHFGLSQGGTTAGGVSHPRGYFRDVVEKGAVKGPILATHSKHDSVVGFAYTSMAALSLNNARAVGDENGMFGGIGRNGVLDTKEAQNLDLKLAGEAYEFAAGKIYNLNGSRKVGDKALIEGHGDIRNKHVTWAFASLVAMT